MTPHGPGRDLTYRAAIGAGAALLRGLDLDVRVQGAETVPRQGPVLLVANHVSFPDFVFIGKGLLGRRRVRFMCRSDIWNQPGLARAMDAMRHIPVDRAAPAAAYLRARGLLREGETVCVFPEAGISATYVVRALMPGAAALARETGVPMVPVSTWGGQRLWPQKRAVEAPFPRAELTRGRLVDVAFGAPLPVAARADLVETTRRLGRALHQGLVTLQQRPEHRPRPGEWAPWHPAHLGGAGLSRAEATVLDALPRGAVEPTWGPA